MEGGSRQKQGRRQRRREARFTVTGNPVHGWRRWTSLYTGMPQRPLLLTMVSTGGLHPRSVTGEGCTVLGDDTLCFQPIASRGGKAVEALLRERCTKEVTVGEGLLRVRYLNPPLVVRTNGTRDRHWSQCWQLMADILPASSELIKIGRYECSALAFFVSLPCFYLPQF